MEYGFVDCHCHISAREFEEVGAELPEQHDILTLLYGILTLLSLL